MTTFQRFLVAGILAGGALLPSVAHAAISYSYVTDANGTTTYNASAGQTLTISIYLKETLTGGSTSLINSDGGLSGYGVAINRLTTPTNAATLVSFVNNSALFGGSTSSDTASPDHVGGFTSISTSQGGAATTNNEILLGTLTITAGGKGTTTQFSLGEHDTGGGNTLTKTDFVDLDFSANAGDAFAGSPAFTGAGNNTETFSVAVAPDVQVPEPASLGLVGLGAAALLMRRRRA